MQIIIAAMPKRRTTSALPHGSPSPEATQRFLVDAMLHDVARDLRLLGHDAAYARSDSDPALLRRAQAEDRVVVTRDRSLARRARGLKCLLLPDATPESPVVWVLRELGLAEGTGGRLSRCLECNAQLEAATLLEAQALLLPDHVALSGDPGLLCPGCGRCYWKGSHFRGLEAKIRSILGALHPENAHV